MSVRDREREKVCASVQLEGKGCSALGLSDSLLLPMLESAMEKAKKNKAARSRGVSVPQLLQRCRSQRSAVSSDRDATPTDFINRVGSNWILARLCTLYPPEAMTMPMKAVMVKMKGMMRTWQKMPRGPVFEYRLKSEMFSESVE